MRWKGGIPPGQRPDAFVSSAIDLASTFCDVAGLAAPASFKGESLLPLATGQRRRNGRQDIYASYHGNQFGLYSQRMVRNQRWKYIWNPTAEDELYDLSADPAELRNRAADISCANELARLRSRMVAWLEHSRDPLLNEWTRRQLLGPAERTVRPRRDLRLRSEPVTLRRRPVAISRAKSTDAR
jgi:arylsulfatase A-like enzyme